MNNKSRNQKIKKSKNQKNKLLPFVFLFFCFLVFLIFSFTIFSKNKFAIPPINGISEAEDNNMAKEKIIRSAAMAGSWYPGDKAELQQMISDFLNQADKQDEEPTILIVPHAGYPYSGSIAAFSFKQLENSGYKKAIIIGPSHNFPVAGLFLSGANFWQTPLGEVKVADINARLADENNFQVNDQVHEPEHSLELQVPFLQAVLPDIEIVPVIVGKLNSSQQSEFVKILEKYLDSETILIVSVDLSHYHDYDEAVDLDNQSIGHILNLDSQGILTDEIDAPWAVASVLELAKQNGWQPKLLKHANSGDVMGDKSQPVVGYAALGFYGSKNQEIKKSKNQEYTEAEKRELLQVARTTIEKHLESGEEYKVETDNPKFQEKRGVFVTLNKKGKLRGCIGYIEPIKPLIEAVRDNAISAAVHDNRFTPVTADELADIEIEISILTVPELDTLEEIIKYKKGVVLKKGNYQATYLPQVWEGLSDPDEFFSSLCLKAGLPGGCYRDSDIELLSYEAIVFSEEES